LAFAGLLNFLSDINNIRDVLKGIEFRTLAASFVFYIPLVSIVAVVSPYDPART
jgi:hypothetical protein